MGSRFLYVLGAKNYIRDDMNFKKKISSIEENGWKIEADKIIKLAKEGNKKAQELLLKKYRLKIIPKESIHRKIERIKHGCKK